MDGAAEGRGAGSGSRSRAAVKVHAADPGGGKECPGMVGRVVGIVKRHAIVVNIVIAVRESAKKGFAVAKPYAVGIYAEGSGRHLQQLAKIRDRGSKILDEHGRDFGSRRPGLEQPVNRGKLRGERAGSV